MEKTFLSLKKILLTFCLVFATIPAFAQSDDTVSLLSTLTNLPGSSGAEKNVRQFLLPIWQKHLKAVKQDGMGDLVGQFNTNENEPTVLLMAHMDELGLLIRDITPEGFIKIEPIGGWESDVVFAQRWLIQTNKGLVYGYSGNESGHIIPTSSQSSHATPSDKVIAVRDLAIDVGATSREDAETRLNLRPGLYMTPDSSFTVLNNSSRYLGKAFDDRVGLALLTQFIQNKESHPNNLWAVATVQEEIGGRGAHVIYNQTKPDVVINIEVCIAGDHPLTRSPNDASSAALGKGPCLYTFERSMLPNQALMDWIIALAKKEHIPYQFASAPNYGQDASLVQQSGEGVPAINIGVPLRYAHQQAGVIDRADYDATLKLIKAIVANLDKKQAALIRAG